MSSYSTALASYLAAPERTQAALAEAVKTAQPNIHRWANGTRFPDATMARAIDAATGGEVPFAIWQQEAARRIGIETADTAAAA
jgi:DNA-binding transcriptional regulator YdaS (Cro superfamily)